MDVARDVVELFSTRDTARAQELALRLHQLNSDRQEEEKRIMEAIAVQLDSDPIAREAYCIVIAGDGWHRGVIGIAATRVVERYGRPAIVIARDEDGQAHGSGRSIPAFHLLDALENCRDLFTRFGGHAHAVGFSLPGDRVPSLAAALDQYARARLLPEDFDPVLAIDGELSLTTADADLYAAVARLEPFGVGNPEPRFLARDARVLTPTKLLKDKHVKFKIGQPIEGRNFVRGYDALGWRMAQDVTVQPGDICDIAFTLDWNDHPEFGGIQLVLADLPRRSQVSTAAAMSAL
jgi:single-stranded-DNA-specific exonuclease